MGAAFASWVEHNQGSKLAVVFGARLLDMGAPPALHPWMLHPSAQSGCPLFHPPRPFAFPKQASSPTLVSCRHMARLKPAFAELLLPHAFADLAVQPGSGALALELGAAMRRELLPRLHRHPKAARLLLGCLNHLRSQYLDAKLAGGAGSGTGGSGGGGRSKSRAGSASGASSEIELWRKVWFGLGWWMRDGWGWQLNALDAMQHRCVGQRMSIGRGQDRCAARLGCPNLARLGQGHIPWAGPAGPFVTVGSLQLLLNLSSQCPASRSALPSSAFPASQAGLPGAALACANLPICSTRVLSSISPKSFLPCCVGVLGRGGLP